LQIRLPFALAILMLATAACGQSKPAANIAKKQDVSATPSSMPPAKPLPAVAAGVTADRILVDKSDRILILYKGSKEIARYTNIRFGDAPSGHKRFEGDEKTPEGQYTINGRNPGSSYHRSLRVSYPNARDIAFAKARGKSPGGDIFIHGQPNGYNGPAINRDWTDGCIAVSNEEIRQIWKLVPDGASISIRP
jgi:murein L,D-transpeptidase YafK